MEILLQIKEQQVKDYLRTTRDISSRRSITRSWCKM